MLMNFIYKMLFSPKKEPKAPATLADLLLHTPDEQKLDFFTRAAEKANEDQRATFNKAHMKHATR